MKAGEVSTISVDVVICADCPEVDTSSHMGECNSRREFIKRGWIYEHNHTTKKISWHCPNCASKESEG